MYGTLLLILGALALASVIVCGFLLCVRAAWNAMDEMFRTFGW